MVLQIGRDPWIQREVLMVRDSGKPGLGENSGLLGEAIWLRVSLPLTPGRFRPLGCVVRSHLFWTRQSLLLGFRCHGQPEAWYLPWRGTLAPI